jgi:putative MFS transporter
LGCFAPILNTVMAESFPSNLRTTGSGVAFGSGRLSNLIVPFTVATVISTLGYAIVGWYILIAWLAVAALLVPLAIYKTRRLARLSQTVDTSENSAGDTTFVS